MHILGAIAEFERARIAERVKAGLARAKAQGKRLGRPKLVVGESVLASVTRTERANGGGETGSIHGDGASMATCARSLTVTDHEWQLVLAGTSIVPGPTSPC